MITALVPMLLLSIATIGTPGPANVAILAASARFGLRSVWPFIFGVILGKQFVIWPVALGLLQMADTAPMVFTILKVISAIYMLYLAWKIAGMSLVADRPFDAAPGFLAGLIVHPLNPKAWALITFVFSGLMPDAGGAWKTAALGAFIILGVQLVFQPIWGVVGHEVAKRLSGHAERAFFIALAVMMLVSIFWAFWGAS